jgi:hypothetical protein
MGSLLACVSLVTGAGVKRSKFGICCLFCRSLCGQEEKSQAKCKVAASEDIIIATMGTPAKVTCNVSFKLLSSHHKLLGQLALTKHDLTTYTGSEEVTRKIQVLDPAKEAQSTVTGIGGAQPPKGGDLHKSCKLQHGAKLKFKRMVFHSLKVEVERCANLVSNCVCDLSFWLHFLGG